MAGWVRFWQASLHAHSLSSCSNKEGPRASTHLCNALQPGCTLSHCDTPGSTRLRKALHAAQREPLQHALLEDFRVRGQGVCQPARWRGVNFVCLRCVLQVRASPARVWSRRRGLLVACGLHRSMLTGHQPDRAPATACFVSTESWRVHTLREACIRHTWVSAGRTWQPRQ